MVYQLRSFLVTEKHAQFGSMFAPLLHLFHTLYLSWIRTWNLRSTLCCSYNKLHLTVVVAVVVLDAVL